MAKKRRNKKKREVHFFDDLSPHTKQAIGAVIFFVLGIFFLMAAFGYAGNLGIWTHSMLSFLFGIGGLILAPLACALFVYIFLKPREDEHVSISKIIGLIIFFISTLGMLSLVLEDGGGLLGNLMLGPLDYLLDGPVAGVTLGAFIFIGIFLLFNTNILSIFRKKLPEEEEANVESLDEALEAEELDEDDEEEDGEETTEEPAEKRSLTDRIGLHKAKRGNFMVTNFRGPYDPPPLSLLKKDSGKPKTGDVKANSNIIKRTLAEFGINVEMDTVEIGPTVTRYALKPAQGVKIARIVGLQRELELNLAAGTIRIEAPIPGKSLVGIEVPNTTKSQVGLASLLTSPEYTDSPKPLLIALGKDITGKAHFSNVAGMPHGLIAGTTGSGKSVMIHNLVVSLLFRNSPEQLRFIMVDPKRVELTLYNGIPHLLTPVITQAKKAILSLKWAVKEMERRLEILEQNKVQNLAQYHEKIYHPAKEAWVKAGEPEDEKEELPEPLPYIVIVMDELADLMHAYPRELEALIVRIAQMARAPGIHLVLATQRPSVNVITGTIKANIPTRIAMQVASQVDSRTIIDTVGAEKLLGQGDMLYQTGELSKPIRLQSAYVSDDELKRVIEYLKNLDDIHELDSINLDGTTENTGSSDAFFASSIDEEEEDDLYEDAKHAVLEAGKASTSYLQRKLRVGYSRAARLIDMLEERGVIGPQDGSKPREIISEGGENEEDESDSEQT